MITNLKQKKIKSSNDAAPPFKHSIVVPTLWFIFNPLINCVGIWSPSGVSKEADGEEQEELHDE